MQIKLIMINVLFEDEPPIIKTVDVRPDENIIDVCRKVDNVGMMITFNKCYNRCSEMMFSDDCFPFINVNGVVKWNVPYSEVTISQFVDTHPNVLRDGLEVEYGYPAAGGAGWIQAWDIIVLWAPVIWQIAVKLGEAKDIFKNVQSIISWFENKFNDKSKMPYPQSFTDYIYHQDIWNHHELAAKLEMDAEQAKSFLKAYGYKWDHTKQAYVVNEDIKKELIVRENNIAYMDK